MTSAAMEGFEACTEEAIRYLIEDEKLPADDPMVVGLREYLFEKQKALAYSNLFDHQVPNFSLPTSLPVNYNLFEQCEEYSLRSDNLSDQSTDSIEISNISSESDMMSEQEVAPETEMAESVDFCDVNNLCLPEDKISAIRALTAELLSLMEQEDDFSDFDDDEEFSSYVMDNEEELDH
ncbi:hypothetical protein LOTGIDRAFT_162852 [Lottia gigantea]|uniref:Uncharacterized protein n=1 Tax=Lottia gigantea TaxID=225164 RepID=V4AAR6_LOTGI|nr:hypothetical protein LOTGIDRAFT_162852 [Lottia gigantea]ESO92195.1 hypothetical protein LOTGIDRAFT_162852 [Lottia gigantea]